MALPPNGLTVLLVGTPEQMIDALVEHECLSLVALADRPAVIEFARQVLREAMSGPQIPGPSAIDCLGRAPMSSALLSKRGRELYNTYPRTGNDNGPLTGNDNWL